MNLLGIKLGALYKGVLHFVTGKIFTFTGEGFSISVVLSAQMRRYFAP